MMLSKPVLMGTLAAFLGFAVPAAMSAPAAAPSANPSRDAVEVTVRGGIPNFVAKLKAGKAVKIGYLGGSITAQNGWRVLSRKWFQQQYPKAKIEEINAAIGGTGSDLGVFRVERDVLVHKPDLLFVEFAVNDGGATPERIRNAMEGIVRKTWKLLPDCDICFVYTITAGDIQRLQGGKMKRSASTMEEIADYYQIPSIHFGLEVAKLEKEGKLVMKAPEAKIERVSGDELNQSAKLPTNDKGQIAFSKDGVHPYPNTGHMLYLKAIIRAMDKILPAGTPGPHKLIAPQNKDNWEAAKMLPLEQAQKSGNWQVLDLKKDNIAKRFASRVPGMWKGNPGAVLKFKFKGTKAAIYDLVGPGCGEVEVTVDGKSRKVRRIDGYCTYYRLGVLNIGDKMEDKVHEVTLRVLPDAPDKRKILFKHNLPDLDKHPEKYQDTNWYPGAVFIIGDLAK